jgi:FkbM family methyltransferase
VIVIDIGAMERDSEESINLLARRFLPDLLFAFDPDPQFEEGIWNIGPTRVVASQMCGWIKRGTVPVFFDGITTRVVTQAQSTHFVASFDVSDLIRLLPQPLVLKLDCEGSEYAILRHISRQHTDKLLELVLVEWHEPKESRNRPKLSCTVEEW